MALERQRDLGRCHASAVVGDLDPIDAATRQRDRYSGRAGVDCVLDQLFQRTGRSFHHFTGGDAVDDMFGQATY